jgi:protein-disulfide isomerase
MNRFRSIQSQEWLNRLATVSVIAACVSIIALVVAVHPAFRTAKPTAKIARGQRPAKPTLPTKPVSMADAAIKSRAGVRVGVIAYSDFQCPYCGRFANETLPDILKNYVDTGKAFVGFRHLPLEMMHPAARRAAEAAECGRREGKFWEVHDMLFSSPQALVNITADAFGTIGGLDRTRFATCLKGQATSAVSRDVEDARSLGISGTPTFFFGVLDDNGSLRVHRRESGVIPYKAFATILDDLIAGRGAPKATN